MGETEMTVMFVMATKHKVCCSTQASKENLDPDLVDFQLPKKRFANPVSEERMSTYAEGVIRIKHCQRFHCVGT